MTAEPQSRWRWAPLIFYLGLSAVAIACAVAYAVLDPGNSELAGVPLIVLGLPWSFAFHNFNPRVIASDYFNAVVVCTLWIALNASIIAAATSLLSNYARRTS
jgi:amino acid permease